ncbi:hypothetical protein [Pantoea ananatis]|uniref:hypothetical protein n=1 Tax=Pantoea ananas TaxID=553 RepID=UPI0007DAB9B7|nr:hypothetical protein [Pantoea ananatis]
MKADNITSLIVQIIRKTVQGEIKWEVNEPSTNFEVGVEDIIPLIYTAKYKDKIMAVFCRRFRYYLDEDEYHWEEKNCFAFLNDSKDKIIWEVSDRRPVLNDLYATVTEKAAGIDEMLESLLG